MARRLLPTGECWCGCKAQVELGSFFAPGHDKKAEARLIMEVFGGVPQFLAAFGYGPNGDERAAVGTWAYWAMKLAGIHARQSTTRFKIEYSDIADPRSVTKRLPEGMLEGQVDLSEGAASFRVDPSSLRIPFIDIAGIYTDGSAQIVHVTGHLKPVVSQNHDGWEYVPCARSSRAVGPAFSSIFDEFVARVSRGRTPLILTTQEGNERRVYSGELVYNLGKDGQLDGMVLVNLRGRGGLMPIPKGVITGWMPQTGDFDFHQQLVNAGYIDGNLSRSAR